MGKLALLLLLLAPLARGQQAAFRMGDKYDPAAIQEDVDDLYNKVKQQKAFAANLTVNGVVTSVAAANPICSSGGANPTLTLCGSLSESQVTNLVSDLANKASNAALVSYEATVAASTASLAAGGATTYLHVDGSNPMVGQLTVSAATFTVTGQDASGYSVKVASGINAGTGCILVQGGQVCGPVQGLTGATGPQGAAGQNGLLTFASDITSFWIVTSTSGQKNYALTVATDGVLVLTSTTTTAYSLGYPNVNRKYLSNGSYTSLLTADDSDGVLRMRPNTVTLRLTDLAVFDTSNVVWDLSMDSDGVIRTTNVGGL